MLVALATNLAIAAAKLVAGLVGTSPALLSEGAHSIADSFNEVLLFTAIKRSERPPDRDHPFGYGKERFFYSMLAGVGIFVAGAGFSVIEGVLSLLHPESGSSDFLLKYLILGGSLVLEGTSWARAVHQVRAEARALGRTALEHVRKTSDPTVKTVATEDSAAIVGLVIAFVGIALHQATGRPIFDAIASLAIGALLVVVAVALVADNKDFLIGQAAEPETREAIRSKVEGYPEVTGVLELMTEVLGPTELLVAARVDFSDSLTAAQVEDLSSRIEEDLHHDFPHVTQVFLDATRGEALPEDH